MYVDTSGRSVGESLKSMNSSLKLSSESAMPSCGNLIARLSMVSNEYDPTLSGLIIPKSFRMVSPTSFYSKLLHKMNVQLCKMASGQIPPPNQKDIPRYHCLNPNSHQLSG